MSVKVETGWVLDLVLSLASSVMAALYLSQEVMTDRLLKVDHTNTTALTKVILADQDDRVMTNVSFIGIKDRCNCSAYMEM